MGTHVVMVLDRSGSMHSQIDNVIEHFNDFKEEMSLIPDVTLTTITFDSEIDVLYRGLSINEAPNLDRLTFFDRGMTALNDAVGAAIRSVEALENRPEKIIIVVNTDGGENNSHEYSTDLIQELVKEKQALDWQFVFVGADIDAFGTGAGYGFASASTMSTQSSWSGYNTSFNTVTAASAGYARGMSSTVDLSKSGITLDSVTDTTIKDTDDEQTKTLKRSKVRLNRSK